MKQGRHTTSGVVSVAERALGTLLRWDESMVNRADPPTAAPIAADRFDWTGTIRAGLPVIRAELDGLLADGVELPETSQLAGSDQGAAGSWTTYVLHWYGRWIDGNCERCPETVALVRDVPHLQVAGFTVLGPGASIPVHQGPAKSLRWQLGVRVPEPVGSCGIRIGGQDVEWADGRSLAFDDRTPHAAWNHSDEARYVFFVQVPWPLQGWRGTVHRTNHRAFGALTSRIGREAAAFDDRHNR